MITEAVVRKLVEERIDGSDIFIVAIHIGSGNTILVEIDSDSGVSVSDCIDVSRGVEHNLDREVEDFALEVTSAGLSKPLRVHRQFVKNIGREVKVTLLDGEKLEGELTTVNENDIVVKTITKEKVEGKKKKQMIEREHVLPFDQIKETYIIISFK